jgi:hypothetical protein
VPLTAEAEEAGKGAAWLCRRSIPDDKGACFSGNSDIQISFFCVLLPPISLKKD